MFFVFRAIRSNCRRPSASLMSGSRLLSKEDGISAESTRSVRSNVPDARKSPIVERRTNDPRNPGAIRLAIARRLRDRLGEHTVPKPAHGSLWSLSATLCASASSAFHLFPAHCGARVSRPRTLRQLRLAGSGDPRRAEVETRIERKKGETQSSPRRRGPQRAQGRLNGCAWGLRSRTVAKNFLRPLVR